MGFAKCLATKTRAGHIEWAAAVFSSLGIRPEPLTATCRERPAVEFSFWFPAARRGLHYRLGRNTSGARHAPLAPAPEKRPNAKLKSRRLFAAGKGIRTFVPCTRSLCTAWAIST